MAPESTETYTSFVELHEISIRPSSAPQQLISFTALDEVNTVGEVSFSLKVVFGP